MKSKLNDKQKIMAYVLNRDMNFNYPMDRIASLMRVSQSTISNAIKEVEYLRQIQNLEMELQAAKAQIAQMLPSPDRYYIDVNVD